MSLSRREFLRRASLAAMGLTAAACAPAYRRWAGLPRPVDHWPPINDANYVALSRLTYGPRPEELQRAAALGLAGWIEEQLAPEAIDDAAADILLRQFPTLTLSANELRDGSSRLFGEFDQAAVPNELRQATLLRQVYSRRQLAEAMVEFWTDHFNISVDKGAGWYLKTVDDREVIRPHALGRFRDLLWASAHSPAMLVYLDNHVSEAAHPNENYARELLELHTLGVGGGYTQADVMALARCLTGWTVKEHWWLGEFQFDPAKHAGGQKTVLGLRIEPDGQAEAERVLEALARHPSTAHFIARKLAVRFLGSDTSTELIDRAAQAFLKTEGDLRAVLRVLLLDGLAAGAGSPKFKRPLNFIVSAARQLNIVTDAAASWRELLTRLGQLPFAWPTPDGYPDRVEAWRGNLLPRWQFALALAHNDFPGAQLDLVALLEAGQARTPEAMADQLALLLLGAPLPAARRAALLEVARPAGEALPQLLVAALLASPAFQWR